MRCLFKIQNNEFLNLEIRRLFSEIEPKALASLYSMSVEAVQVRRGIFEKLNSSGYKSVNRQQQNQHHPTALRRMYIGIPHHSKAEII